MIRIRKVPLAWLNLTHDKRRFAVSVAGISFAVLLMFVELGFWNALLESTVQIVRRLNADVFVASKTQVTFTDGEAFRRDRLYLARGVDGVEAALPFYVRYGPALWQNEDPRGRDPLNWTIRVLGYDPDPEHPTFRAMPEVEAYAAELRLPDTVLMDERSKTFYDVIARRLLHRPSPLDIEREVSGKRLHIVGRFRLGTDFTSDGNLLMTAANLERFFPDSVPGRSTLDSVELGLLQLAPGADRAAVVRDLRAVLPDDVVVLTREELIERETEFWRSSTPIGFTFGLGLVMGFIVGVVICYQILATDVADHLSEYATIKALGYPDRYLAKVVMQEALLLSVLGFFPGLAFALILYDALARRTGLPLELTPWRGGLILVLTMIMCSLSGLLALRKVRQADPAEVFG